jgi:hypothetical protein
VATRLIKRLSDSAEILVEQPGDKRCPIVGTRDRVLVRHDEQGKLKFLDGLFCDPYKALCLLRDGEAVVVEED